MSRTAIDEVGNRYGRLVVLHRAPKGRQRAYWVCRCDCGQETAVRGSHLRSGNVTSCGCLASELSGERARELGIQNAKDEVGGRYWRLQVIASAGRDGTGALRWLCRCECGTEKVITGRDLRSGAVVSCGCQKAERARALTDARRLEEGEAAFRQLYKKYEYRARKRGHQFNLTRSEFRALTEQSCHYCGAVPSQVYGANTEMNGSYTYNGVDRVDNERGYEPENCVPCCKTCNSAKSNMSYEEFMAYLDRLVAFRSRG